MNEPGTSATSRTHVSEIHPVTQQAGQKYFIKERNLTHGLTLGIQNLMESKFVMLLVSGKKKAEMVKKVVEEEITNEIPASFLRNHPNFYLYLDLDASSNLQLMKDV
jgi:galactosamine-6-phosphate isomerase